MGFPFLVFLSFLAWKSGRAGSVSGRAQYDRGQTGASVGEARRFRGPVRPPSPCMNPKVISAWWTSWPSSGRTFPGPPGVTGLSAPCGTSHGSKPNKGRIAPQPKVPHAAKKICIARAFDAARMAVTPITIGHRGPCRVLSVWWTS